MLATCLAFGVASQVDKRMTMDVKWPSATEFKRGVNAFRQREERDAMYKTASFLVSHFWGSPRDLADSVGVLLLTWNQAFYRYGLFDFDRLETTLRSDQRLLNAYRRRDISSLSDSEPGIQQLFEHMMRALKIRDGKKKGASSPVAVAKALHLLAPHFFPLWDKAIASSYRCYYGGRPLQRYLRFMGLMRDFVQHMERVIISIDNQKSPLKVIDEFNYAKYTKRWI
jgi:hypothetical protein